MALSEDELCQIFAERTKESPEFSEWVLAQTKFAAFAKCSRLLHEEQASIRPRKHWWRHWWCNAPGLQKAGRETDIFMVFETDGPPALRFALHFENKRDNYRFSEGQAEDYKPRARHMIGKDEYLNHSEYATILLATQNFKDRFPNECGKFDGFIAYDKVARFIPEFGQ